MRFHHSTRRGRNRFSQAPGGGGGHHSSAAYGNASASCGTGGKFGNHPSALSNRWAQLSYCRQTNLHFNRRLPVELPEEMRHDQLMRSVLADRTANATSKHNHEQPQQPQQDQQQAVSTATEEAEKSLEKLDKLSLGTSANERHQHSAKHRQGSVRLRASPAVHHHGRREKSFDEQSATLTSKEQVQLEQEDKSKKTTTTTTTTTKARGKLDLEDAREKLIAKVEKHPFWSNKAAKRMRLLDLNERQVYIYELISYCERRDLEWRYEPYRGGKLHAATAASAATPLSSTNSLTTPATGTRRPVLSSVSELSTPVRAPLTGAGAGSTRRAAASQTASPLQSPTFVSDKLHSLSYELQQDTLTTGGGGGGGGEPEFAHSKTSTSRQQQSIRRSCSSVAGSPVHSAAGSSAPGKRAQLTAPSSPVRCASAALSFEPPLAPPALALGAASPRPTPSASFVWSIEPPEHLKPALFASYVHTSEVPGTSFLKKCHGCEGRGRLKCSSCYGVGYEVCLSCTGKGSMRTYNSAFGAGGGGGCALSSGARSLGPRGDHYNGGPGGRDSGGSSMWDNATSDSTSSRLGSGRHDEPGGISSGGSALSSSEVCASCSGAGQKRCWICAGRSYITCTACAGTGNLRCHLNLNITYINHRDELCLNNSDGIIPRERLKLSSGLLLADEIADRLAPIASSSRLVSLSSFSPAHSRDGATSGNLTSDKLDNNLTTAQTPKRKASRYHSSQALLEQVAKPMELSQLNAMSHKLLEKHAESYLKSERLIKQRHKVTQIECFKIDWEFRKKRGHFVVYGDERKVYIAKYPFKSICNIT